MRRFIAVCLVWVLSSPLWAGVQGRTVRLEAPVSERMVAHEIEVFAGAENVARRAKFAGLGFRGVDINDRNGGKQLTDGQHDLAERGVTMGTAEGVGPWVELDFGKTIDIDKVVVWQGPEPTYADRGLRLVTVLDADRRVVFAGKFDVRESRDGSVAVTVNLQSRLFRGTLVAPATTQWAAVSELLDAVPMSLPPEAPQRAAEFAKRDSAESLARLSREFFARIDLAQPGLSQARAKFERGEHAAALEAFRAAFLARIQRVTFLHEHPRDSRRYGSEADDLQRGVWVNFETGVEAMRLVPGQVDWCGSIGANKKAVEARRDWLLAGVATRALLTQYRETGDARYLDQWCALNDDWAMNIQRDLNRIGENDLRDYFVKTPLQEFNHLASELAETARTRPEFARRLNAATLARLLMVVVEEYPPAYWWVCRRTVFNHTFNALNAGYVTSQVLADFHAGQRLARENAEHWQRLWTFNLTRDGSMQEIGDEGHLDMALRIGVYFEQMKRDRRGIGFQPVKNTGEDDRLEAYPTWFTPAYEARFETGFEQMLRYLVRHATPNGMGHRYNVADQFERIWGPTENVCRIGGMIPRPTFDSRPVYNEPEMRAILQSLFGAARDPQSLSPARRLAREQVVSFYGDTFTPPITRSDWMPYAGLAYLRGSWEPDAPFVNLIGQPTGHPESNGRDWTTEFRWWDHGTPLLHARPLRINGHPQCPDLDRQTLAPGSKTERLATASQFPVPARWHSSEEFDFAESFFEGDYATLGANLKEQRLAVKGTPTRGVRTTRMLVQIRGARLFVTADVVSAAKSKSLVAELPYLAWSPSNEKKPTKSAQAVSVESGTLTLRNGRAPSATVRHFSPAKMSWLAATKMPPVVEGTRADFGPSAYVGEERTLRAESTSGLLVASLLESHANDAATRVKSIRDLSTSDVAGFAAELNDSSKLTWLVSSAPRPLSVGNIAHVAAGLLVWEQAGRTSGLVLGAKPATGASGDFEFVIANGRTTTTPIHRPISPVEFLAPTNVFTDSVTVALRSATPDVELHYTLDGSEPTRRSPRYSAPLVLHDSTAIRARAFRPGVTEIPFTASGTDVTVISDAQFTKRAPLPASSIKTLEPGLRWELCEGHWLSLFSHLHLPDVLPAQATGTTARLLDVSMRQADGPFGIRQSGWLDVPTDGVYTFHAPREYIGATCEPGYDLRVFVDGEEWSLGQNWHGLGAWSIPLSKGPHRLLVTFADARHRDRLVHKPGLWRGYPAPWIVWPGEVPVLEVTAPNLPRLPIPQSWLKSTSAAAR